MKLRSLVGAVFEEVPNGFFKFYMAVRASQLSRSTLNPVLLAYTLDINEFRGRQSLQLMVRHLEPVSDV